MGAAAPHPTLTCLLCKLLQIYPFFFSDLRRHQSSLSPSYPSHLLPLFSSPHSLLLPPSTFPSPSALFPSPPSSLLAPSPTILSHHTPLLPPQPHPSPLFPCTSSPEPPSPGGTSPPPSPGLGEDRHLDDDKVCPPFWINEPGYEKLCIMLKKNILYCKRMYSRDQ